MSDPRYLQLGHDAQSAHVVEEIGEMMGPLGDLLAALGKTRRWGWNSSRSPIIGYRIVMDVATIEELNRS